MPPIEKIQKSFVMVLKVFGWSIIGNFIIIFRNIPFDLKIICSQNKATERSELLINVIANVLRTVSLKRAESVLGSE